MDIPHDLPFTQPGELDPAWLVLAHRPSLEVFAGSVHPGASLFETGISIKSAGEAHAAFVKAIQEAGPHVVLVEDVLRNAPLEKLIELASDALQYEFRGNPSKLDPAKDLPMFTEAYKRAALEGKSSDELINIIFTRPLVIMHKEHRGGVLYIEGVQLRPLSNLVFVRDQQIVTARGVVMGNLNTPQRRPEKKLLTLVFELLGVQPIAEMHGDQCLEGGDFLPLSRDLAFIGVGLRTNMNSVRRLMDEDLLGTRRLAVVRDAVDLKQKRMHLDTVFNIVDEHTVVLWESIVTDPARRARLVDLYERAPASLVLPPGEDGGHGPYKLVRSGVPIYDFLSDEGFRIVLCADQQQAEYLPNFVNLGRLGGPRSPAHIIAVHPGLGAVLEAAGVEGVHVEYVDYRGITRMYGAAHCTTQVFRRSHDQRAPVSPAISPRPDLMDAFA